MASCCCGAVYSQSIMKQSTARARARSHTRHYTLARFIIAQFPFSPARARNPIPTHLPNTPTTPTTHTPAPGHPPSQHTPPEHPKQMATTVDAGCCCSTARALHGLPPPDCTSTRQAHQVKERLGAGAGEQQPPDGSSKLLLLPPPSLPACVCACVCVWPCVGGDDCYCRPSPIWPTPGTNNED